MEIKGSHIQSKLNVYHGARAQGKNMVMVKSENTAASTPQQDRVALSGRGQSIADAQRAMAAVPDVRDALVSQIRNDLLDGTYVFDNQRAAEGILRESMVNQAALA
ncbi:flagellar biosynthesis anti-sigma factor FlgM [Desulfosarcina sp.]|uniref:flagellar biosynthesis anti-sigma factor FlgM n=1 Tax=Desulfosarcina sp. TaxID=2027861 RepID=UPI00356A23ED